MVHAQEIFVQMSKFVMVTYMEFLATSEYRLKLLRHGIFTRKQENVILVIMIHVVKKPLSTDAISRFWANSILLDIAPSKTMSPKEMKHMKIQEQPSPLKLCYHCSIFPAVAHFSFQIRCLEDSTHYRSLS